MDNGTKFYAAQLLAAGSTQHDQDYDALDQGPEGTLKRHTTTISILGSWLRSGTVVDLGCGTGLLLDTLATYTSLPDFYVGVDLLEDRRKHVEARLLKHGISGRYETRDLTKPWDRFGVKVTACLAVGLVGPYPFHTLSSIKRLMANMKQIGGKGIITIPMQYPGFLGCAYQTHFDPEDVQEMLYTRNVRAHTEKEMVVWW